MHPARVNVINIIQLLADTNAQLEYHQNAPVNVANELVNQWFDDSYHPDSEWFREPFSTHELLALSEFNSFYDERFGALPDSLPEMLETKVWNEIVSEAQFVLSSLGWANIVARYDKS